MVIHHFGATKNTDVSQGLTNCKYNVNINKQEMKKTLKKLPTNAIKIMEHYEIIPL